MTTVLVFGTFDVIHSGHKWFLKKAAAKGDRLIAVVSRDNFVHEWKGRSPLLSEESRRTALIESGLVDDAILADSEIRTYGVLSRVNPDIICLGHDQKALQENLISWLERIDQPKPQIEVLPPWRRRYYSSTRLNRSLRGVDRRETTFGRLGLITLTVFAMIAFGFSWVSGKRISGTTSPAILAFWRFLLTAACFLPFIFQGRKALPQKKNNIKGLAWTVAASISLTAYNLLFFKGLEAGMAGKGGLIVTTLNPLFTFLIVLVISRTKPSFASIIGIVIGIIGGILLLEPWKISADDFMDSSNLIFLLAAVFWSLLTYSGKKAQEFLSFGRFNAGLYIVATLLILPFALPGLIAEDVASFGTRFWFDLIFIAVVVGAFGTGIYFMTASRLGAAKGSAFTYLVPVSALIFTSVILDEKPDIFMILGGIFAILAVILINRSGKKVRSSLPNNE